MIRTWAIDRIWSCAKIEQPSVAIPTQCSKFKLKFFRILITVFPSTSPVSLGSIRVFSSFSVDSSLSLIIYNILSVPHGLIFDYYKSMCGSL